MQHFLENGVRFQCQGCGKCCTGEPGTVYLDLQEIRDIAAYLNIVEKDFIREYTYIYEHSYCLWEFQDGSCVFYRSGCEIYEIRPNQCRTYPFWFKNIRNEHNWQEVIRECPGIGTGTLYSWDTIREIAQSSVL